MGHIGPVPDQDGKVDEDQEISGGTEAYYWEKETSHSRIIQEKCR